ncbi:MULTISPECIES: hypothetical protein [unclassified Endozoicomonas]|uniref:hypothetical protein n=1 Tax=unclassified Endozoicomonas TaxID=2644528 RepID=UPI003BB7AE86
METNEQKLILKNLIDRIYFDNQTGEQVLPGVITTSEIKVLSLLLDKLNNIHCGDKSLEKKVDESKTDLLKRVHASDFIKVSEKSTLRKIIDDVFLEVKLDFFETKKSSDLKLNFLLFFLFDSNKKLAYEFIIYCSSILPVKLREKDGIYYFVGVSRKAKSYPVDAEYPTFSFWSKNLDFSYFNFNEKNIIDIASIAYEKYCEFHEMREFKWPTTDIFKGSDVSPALDFTDNKGLLSIYGYRVGKNGKSESERKNILRKLMELNLRTENLRLDENYIYSWGQGNTKDRLKKLAYTLAAFVKNAKRKKFDYKESISDWEQDLAFLKENYYDGFYSFAWPTLISIKSN